MNGDDLTEVEGGVMVSTYRTQWDMGLFMASSLVSVGRYWHCPFVARNLSSRRCPSCLDGWTDGVGSVSRIVPLSQGDVGLFECRGKLTGRVASLNVPVDPRVCSIRPVGGAGFPLLGEHLPLET